MLTSTSLSTRPYSTAMWGSDNFIHHLSTCANSEMHHCVCICICMRAFRCMAGPTPPYTDKMLMVSGRVKCFFFMRPMVPIRCPHASMPGGQCHTTELESAGGLVLCATQRGGNSFFKKGLVCIWVLIVTTTKLYSGNNFRVGKSLSLKDPNARHKKC